MALLHVRRTKTGATVLCLECHFTAWVFTHSDLVDAIAEHQVCDADTRTARRRAELAEIAADPDYWAAVDADQLAATPA